VRHELCTLREKKGMLMEERKVNGDEKREGRSKGDRGVRRKRHKGRGCYREGGSVLADTDR